MIDTESWSTGERPRETSSGFARVHQVALDAGCIVLLHITIINR